MPRTGHRRELHEYRNTAASNRGAHRAVPSSVRNDGDHLTGDPPPVRAARWENGASTCGSGTHMSDRSLHKVSSSRPGELTGCPLFLRLGISCAE